MIIKWILLLLFFCSFSLESSAQNTLQEQIQSEYGVSMSKVKHYYGLLDEALLVHIAYCEIDNVLQGLITYGNNAKKAFPIEGRIDSSHITLYEYNGDEVVAVIKGKIDMHVNKWYWHTNDYSVKIPFILIKSNDISSNVIQAYTNTASDNQSQIILRLRNRDISIEREDNLNLRWTNYYCEGKECIEGRPDEKLENPIEFELKDKSITVFPHQEYELEQELQSATLDVDSLDFFISYSYPFMDQDPFDDWVQEAIQRQLLIDMDDLKKGNTHRGKYAKRAFGDFYISLLSKDIVSGYLLFRSTENARLHTLPFNYDRNKKRFYQLKDIFKKDFDYPYFLSTNISKKKRNLVYKEESVLKKLIREEPFTHMIFSNSGLVFFTDFNTIFGRRHLLIPYSELESFVGDKSLNRFILKKARNR